MGRKENAADIARERANNLVRAVEATKSARQSVALVNCYAGDGETGPLIDDAIAKIARLEDCLRRKSHRG